MTLKWSYVIRIRVGRKTLRSCSVNSQISSKTSRGKKDNIKRHYHRHHQRQPGEQHFPYRWSTTSLTFTIHFPYFYIYIYNENNHTPQNATSKITKEPKQKSRLGTASNEITWGHQLVYGRLTLAFSSALVPQTLSCKVTPSDQILLLKLLGVKSKSYWRGLKLPDSVSQNRVMW